MSYKVFWPDIFITKQNKLREAEWVPFLKK